MAEINDTKSIEAIRRSLALLAAEHPQFAVDAVQQLLLAATVVGASDLHLVPGVDGLEVRWRVDGVLQMLTTLPASVAPNVIARLKVLAGLLTYRTDLPQEGRLRDARHLEMRISTFPTVFGEKGVVRLFAAAESLSRLDHLGLPADIATNLRRCLNETSGVILVTGPAGSGKTTTLYACLRELVATSKGGRSLVSLEDPVEVLVPGVAQSQINAANDFDLATGLRFLMRQDPEVVLVGEIRDQATAEAALQASLTGHLILSSFHASSAAGAIGRLADMGIAPYVLRSGVLAVLCQRLVRKLCNCAQATSAVDARLGLPVDDVRIPAGCTNCQGSGYRGRIPLAELLLLGREDLGRSILSATDSARLEALAVEHGMVTRWQRAIDAVRSGLTSPAEVCRVLGFFDGNAQRP